MSKRNRDRKYICREEEKKKIEEGLDRLSQSGLIGKSQIMPNGERAWEIEPIHQEFMLDILKHPERWDEVPAFKKRKADLFELRDMAIKKGLIPA